MLLVINNVKHEHKAKQKTTKYTIVIALQWFYLSRKST